MPDMTLLMSGMRVTSRPTMVMTPPIMVIINTMTSHFNRRSEAGRMTVSDDSELDADTGIPLDDGILDDGTLDNGAIAWLSVTIPEGAAPRLDKALADAVPENAALSRSRLSRMIDEGAVFRAGIAVTNQKAKVTEGEVYDIRLDLAEAVETLAEDFPLVILFEDADLIVIDKPVGMVVHPAPGTPRGTLVNALLHHFGGNLSGVGGARRPGIVHRIDKDTSGLLVVAKSDRAHHGLAAQFEAHTVNRHYLAVVHTVPMPSDPRLRGTRGISFEAGGILKIATHLDRHRTDRQRQAVTWDQGRHAVTRVHVVQEFKGAAALVDCWLETGRTHQIRVHMAYAGHGLIGDQTYGGKRLLPGKLFGLKTADLVNSFPRQALHAATLGFDHPVTGAPMEFTSPLPVDMENLVQALSRDKPEA
jgi:23S rRNA pseudouridine1911/1915/1917 synthase